MKSYTILAAGIMAFVLASCTKLTEEYLNIKQNPSIVTPNSIQDYQALLDNATNNIQSDAWMNFTSSHRLGLVGAGEFYVEDARYNSLSDYYVYEKNGYTWQETPYTMAFTIELDDWFNGYKRVYYCNLVLSGIQDLKPGSYPQEVWDNVKGSALFFRALNFFDLAQLYCKHYDPATADTDLGIPLRESYEVTVRSTRATVAQTYAKIISDLEIAVPLLPDHGLFKFRPSKTSVYTLLAKTYMIMGDFENMRKYADLALGLHDELMDYNMLDSGILFPFGGGDKGASNPEIFFFTSSYSGLGYESRFNVDSVLLKSYAIEDLRPSIYFREHDNGNIMFKGSYTGDGSEVFTGFATAELWLMRAEAYARLGQSALAMDDLNHLLKHRYANNTPFASLAAADAEEALRLVLEHRRKELIMRGTRWSDLRRLNTDARFAETLVRVLNGVRYELKPNSVRYVWRIPPEEIELSNMKQNP